MLTWAPSADKHDNQSAAGSACARLANGSARAHGAIGNAAGNAGQEATGWVRDAAVLDGGMRYGRTDRGPVSILADGG